MKWVLTIVTLMILLTGCNSSITGSATQELDRVDVLRSLPYVGWSEEEAGEERGITLHNKQKSLDGYNLYNNRDLNSAVLMDNYGNVYNEWNYDALNYWSHVELLPNGDLLVEANTWTILLDWENNLKWKTQINSHHDVEQMPDGNIAVLTYTVRPTDYSEEVDVRDDRVTILSPDGGFIDEISLYDILNDDPNFEFIPIKPNPRGNIDLIHANSVEFFNIPELEGKHEIYSKDNVLVNMRHQNTVIINWKTQEIVWQYGHETLDGPHDANYLPNGNILIFDNGLERGWSRAVEVDPMTKEIVWEYYAEDKESFYSAGRGADQRLSNGNTLLTESGKGRSFEVTPDGEIVWEFFNPEVNNNNKRAVITRMFRYDEEFVEPLLK